MKAILFIFASFIIFISVIHLTPASGQGTDPITSHPNLAVVANPSGSVCFGPSLNALNDGLTPMSDGNSRRGGGAGRPLQRRSMLWVQYEGTQPGLSGKYGDLLDMISFVVADSTC